MQLHPGVRRDLPERGGSGVVRERRAGVRIVLAPGRRAAGVALAAGLVLLLSAPAAEATERVVLYDVRTPVGYRLELEPHLLLGTAPPGPGRGSGAGVGVRASLVLSPEGFIRGVNDSLSLGFGLDFGRYAAAYGFDGYRDQCLRFEPGPAGTAVCTEVTSNGGSYSYVFVPVVLQWNFWLTERFSVFGEPGLTLYALGDYGLGAGPALYIGGRFRLAERITLTARLGYPTIAFGVSFLM
jgi:hypothetical protein